MNNIPLDPPCIIENTKKRISEYSIKGFAKQYADFRPQPPSVMLDIITQLAGPSQIKLVVDLGSGTGLSTRIWSERSQAVIGIEPNDEMRHQAETYKEANLTIDNVWYQSGYSFDTKLASESVDIATCAQSLHWMEPEPTFLEAARILRIGGIFAAYDYTWPPTVNWELEVAYHNFMKNVINYRKKVFPDNTLNKWAKEAHLNKIQNSKQFHYVKEVYLHNIETGNAAQFMGIVLSQGIVFALLEKGITEEILGLNELKLVAQRVIGEELKRWYFSYRLLLAIK